MTANAHRREGKWEAVDYGEEDLEADDRVDELRKEALGEDGVFFYQFGEVVEARCCLLSVSE